MIQNGICCFTGHRDFERTVTDRQMLIFQKLVDNLIGYGYTTFVAGGALGFDTVAAEYIIKKREEGCNVRLELVLPCADQEARWGFMQKRRYKKMLKAADNKPSRNKNRMEDRRKSSVTPHAAYKTM